MERPNISPASFRTTFVLILVLAVSLLFLAVAWPFLKPLLLGAMLAEERDRVDEARQRWGPGVPPDGLRVVTKRQPTSEEWSALRFAWRISAHVKSNTVIFTDAQRTLLAFGFGTLGLERVWLTVTADNARAIRSYEKVGFQLEGVMRRAFRVRGRLTDSLLMSILRDEWEAAAAANG